MLLVLKVLNIKNRLAGHDGNVPVICALQVFIGG